MDVNGDGRTDVLVGAPNYIGKGEKIYDQGAVFVYLNKEEVRLFKLLDPTNIIVVKVCECVNVNEMRIW